MILEDSACGRLAAAQKTPDGRTPIALLKRMAPDGWALLIRIHIYGGHQLPRPDNRRYSAAPRNEPAARSLLIIEPNAYACVPFAKPRFLRVLAVRHLGLDGSED